MRFLMLLYVLLLSACVKVNSSDRKLLTCVDVILKKDSELGKIRNNACKNKSLSETIDEYVSSLEKLNYNSCSDDFTKAFKSHRVAWLAAKQTTNKHPDLRGEMHDLFDSINKHPTVLSLKNL